MTRKTIELYAKRVFKKELDRLANNYNLALIRTRTAKRIDDYLLRSDSPYEILDFNIEKLSLDEDLNILNFNMTLTKVVRNSEIVNYF